jgi:tetratricopeptide (TPR) repeat protein
MTLAEAVRGFLDALAVPPGRIPADLGAQTALYRSLLSGKRMLIVLDNARDAEQVRPLLPGSAGCLALVTSRRQLTSLVALDGAELLLLDVLTQAEARALLAHRLGRARVEAEPAAVDTIVNRCARLPLALAVAAAGAATRPVTPLAELARELGEVGLRLDTLSGGDAVSDVRAVFSWSYHALSPAAAELFRLLGLHPGPDLSLPATASLAGLARADVVPPLAELLEAHLLTEHTPGRYSFHDLLRAYATELSQDIDPPERRRAGLHRLLDHYLHTAHQANRLLTPARDNVTPDPERPGVTPESLADYAEALAWFTTEHQVLLAALDQAASAGFDTHTWQLAYHLVTYLRRQGHRQDYATSQRAAVAAAARLDQPAVQALAQRMLGDAYRMLGRLDDAEEQLQQALALAARAGDLTGQAQTHQLLNIVREIQGRYPDALDHARQALDLYLEAGERGGQANALNAVGWCHTLLGDYQGALDPCERALALFREIGDRAGEAYTWDSLGYAHHPLGHHGEAVACYQHSIDLLRQLGARYDEAYALEHLGDTHHAAGDGGAARAAYDQALTILDDLGHPKADKLRERLGELGL